MPSSSEPYDTEYWRKRAEEARALAGGMQDAHTKLLTLGIAEMYEQIAKSYETVAKWRKRTPDPNSSDETQGNRAIRMGELEINDYARQLLEAQGSRAVVGAAQKAYSY